MSEEQRIERIAETATDLLDDQLMSGELTQAGYNEAIARLNQWLEAQYSRIAHISTTIH